MGAALQLARRGLGLARPNPSVGCVIVSNLADGPVIIGRGVTSQGGRPHAEANALAEAGGRARGATAYVTLEPCSHIGRAAPCADSLVEAGIARVVCALEDPDPRVSGRGFARLEAAGLAVTRGVRRAEALELHRGHLARVLLGRPHVTLKLALSADGKLGLPGRRVAITGERANQFVHRLRSRHDGIAVGIGTVLTDDPLLNVRLPGMAQRSPTIVIFDTRLRLPPSARLLLDPQAGVHCLTGLDAPADRAASLAAKGILIHRLPPPWLVGEGINLDVALRELGKAGITTLFLEGGLALAQSFLARDLIDEMMLVSGEILLGPQGLAALNPGPLDAYLASKRFKRIGTEQFGSDRLLIFQRRG